MHDPEQSARDALSTLVAQAHTAVVYTPDALAAHKGGTAVYNMARDRPLSDLPQFSVAVAALRVLPQFVRAFGTAHESRAVLQFLYDYFTRTDRLVLDEEAFSATFDGFLTEIRDPNWTYVSFANLRNFETEDVIIDFGDGLSIRGRSYDDIEQNLGWTEWHFQQLERDWMDGQVPSSYVIWAESFREKSEDTAILSDSGTGTTKILDLLLALWLHAPGDLSIGAIFSDRAARFDLSGGLSRSNGMPGDSFGARYALSASDVSAVRAIYDDVVSFRLSSRVPPNVRLAVNRFSSVYARDLRQREDRIVDELIALEALVGSRTELRFRLAFRVASLLASEDDQRLELFDSMKRYYDVRSKIVHGSALRGTDRALVQDDAELRAVIRRLLRAVIFATVHSDVQLSATFIDKHLDEALLDSRKRHRLRTALNLT